VTSATAVGAPGSPRRYLHSLWLLSARDLRVRYATSALGYLWSILDPLVMSIIYWFVFTQVFHRGHVGDQPYIVFLLSALLPWVWFNASVSDFTTAFNRDARLVRSTAIPRTIWMNRIVLSKGIEFIYSLPVLAVFAIFTGAHLTWYVVWLPVAVVVQAVLLVGLGLIIAPLCVLWKDLERTTRLVLRALFYVSPIIYGLHDLPPVFKSVAIFNPLSGIFTMYRVAFFPDQWDAAAVVASVLMSFAFLVVGVFVFRSLERPVLKEL
jgi:ABC-2 type transport system permease protein